MLLINLIGSLDRNITGYGAFTRGFWNALLRARNKQLHLMFTEYLKQGEVERNAHTCRAFPGRVVNVWLQVGPGHQVLQHFPGEKVAYTMFETDALPDGWVEGLSLAHRVFTPSEWGRQVMMDHGLEAARVHVVPGGVERPEFTPWGPKLHKLEGPAFRFLMIGAFQARKGYAELFTAFRQAFGDRSDVELVIKANIYADRETVHRRRTEIMSVAPARTRIVEGVFDDAGMAALYRSCHCFVFPSRGEGCGLPLFEAMACGLPVIATRCSGHTQLLDRFKDQFIEVDAVKKKVDAPDFLRWYQWRHGAGNWFEPDIGSLAKAMARVQEHGVTWDPLSTALDVRQRCSWDASVDAALRVLVGGADADRR